MDLDKEKSLDALKTQLALFQTLTHRANVFSRLGYSYGGDRDLYQALGYKQKIFPEDYAAIYSRNALASAVIDRPVDATWRGDVVVQAEAEKTETEETDAFDEAWKDLDKQLKLQSVFKRADRLIGMGRFGVLFLGFDDVINTDDFVKPVNPGKRKLLYVKPLSEIAAKVKTVVNNPKDPRFSLPETYSITIATNDTGASGSLLVHHTRVIHLITEKQLESEVYGIPRLEAVYNNLTDVEKIIGGSAEMFWRGARPGYQGKVDPEYNVSSTFTEDLKTQVDEYENNLRRIFVNEGFELKALQSQVSSPKAHLDAQLEIIAAEKSIPKRILTGSERGELASTQDRSSWFDTIDGRRHEFAEPNVVRAFVDICINHGVLPLPKEKSYIVIWTDLASVSEEDQAKVGEIKAKTLNYYGSSTSQDILPVEFFYKYILKLTDDQIIEINRMRDQAIGEEEQDFNQGAEGEGE